GKVVPLSEAKLGVMTHALLYGTALFEGIRGNWNEQREQTYLFRLADHYERLLKGCRLLNIELPYSVGELCRITIEMVGRCQFKEDIYVRPLAYKSSESLGVRLHDLQADFTVFAIPWGPYLDMDKARCAVSSWRRPADNSIPPQAKITGLYVNNALAKTEAINNGFDEAIMLSPDGHVSEGSGENIFLVINGKLVTPPTYDSILMGFTRDTVMTLAADELGLEVVERPIDRGELYIAEECFLTGTAAHITPVSEIDYRPVGSGEVGENTRKLQTIYADVIRGNNAKYLAWCTPCYEKAAELAGKSAKGNGRVRRAKKA
ncbi:MAG: branched-chain amino acid transaminase, partial [Chloroflexi bacterium]|nr:branched-chain amino acid transaminase [Chloroflexota bacterium]